MNFSWVDSSVNTEPQNITIQKNLRQKFGQLLTFERVGNFEQYLDQNTRENIVLITNNALGRTLLPKIHEKSNLIACFIFCQNRTNAQQWSAPYKKVFQICVTEKELIESITEYQKNASDTDFTPRMSILDNKSNDINNHNATFLWFQLFIEILVHMQHKKNDFEDFIEMCREYYRNNPEELEKIQQLEQNYTCKNVIWWYTRDSCFHRLLNKSLREQDYDTLFRLRFFLSDLTQEIKRQYENSMRNDGNREKFTVYRGQTINPDELELLKNHIGDFLSISSFLSTSRERDVAMNFIAGHQHGRTQAILFEIEIDPKMRTKSFADISKLSFYEAENEVLIGLGALFLINEVVQKQDEQRLWIAKVSLASDDDYRLKDVYSDMRQKIGNAPNLDSLGKLLLRMGENQRAKQCYLRMVEQTQLAMADASLGLGWALLRLDELQAALKSFEDSLEIRRRIHGENSASVAEVYGFMGDVFRKNKDYETSIEWLLKAIDIQQVLTPDSTDLAACYETLGDVYLDFNQLDLAMKYFEKTLEIRKNKFPKIHPQMAHVYGRIGNVYYSKKDRNEALRCLRIANDIGKKTLATDHPSMIWLRKSLSNAESL